MTDDVADVAALLLQTQHGWLRERLAALDAALADAHPPAELARSWSALRDAVRTGMAREEATILPLVQARTCRALTRARPVAELAQELRIGHRHVDDHVEGVRAAIAGAGPLRGDLRQLLDDLAEHQLEEESRLFDALPGIAGGA